MTRILIPSGALGLDYDRDALARGVAMKPDLIAIDGGSTDSGPSYLGRGVSKYARSSTRTEWKGLIAAAQEAGLDVRLGDSLEALAALEDNSLSVITAHHLVEHLPFDKVAWIAREAMRVLSPGGLLMFETPHTRNVLVGATTFHTDPTHLKPMPEQVLEVLFETAGFHPIEVRALHAHERFDEFVAKPDFNNELAFLMFGPQDLSVLGIKPTGE